MNRTLKPGDRVSEYVLEERVGVGGFGEVWRARHRSLDDRVVAVKVPGDPERAALLKREGALQDRVKHPNAVEVLGMDADADPPYLIMAYVDGESLRARLGREGRLAPALAVEVAVQVLGALEHAHARGVVHRDLKPENVLLAKDGKALLTDFGLGRLLDDERQKLSVSGSLASQDGRAISGTLAYMAPEQREPGRAVDARADLYALGIVLFEMLTGSRPEGSEAPSDLVAGLDPRLDDVFRKCYCRLEKRYASAAAAIADLAPLATRGAVVAAAGPLALPVAAVEALDADGALLSRFTLRDGGTLLADGLLIERRDGAWWIVAATGAVPTTVLPASAPSGHVREEYATKVGTAPLKLGEGVTIAVGAGGRRPARYRFRDGAPTTEPRVEHAQRAWARGTAEAERRGRALAGFAMGMAGGLVALVGLLVRAPSLGIFGGAAILVAAGVAAVRSAAPPRAQPVERYAAPPMVLAIGRPAGVWIRTFALVIDVVLFVYLARILGPRTPLAFFLYDWLMTGICGATAGKFLLGLEVRGEDGAPIGLLRALGRTLAKMLAALPMGLGFLLAAFTPSKQGLHDFLTGTRTIRLHRAED